jgi:hypothetical protein
MQNSMFAGASKIYKNGNYSYLLAFPILTDQYNGGAHSKFTNFVAWPKRHPLIINII